MHFTRHTLKTPPPYWQRSKEESIAEFKDSRGMRKTGSEAADRHLCSLGFEGEKNNKKYEYLTKAGLKLLLTKENRIHPSRAHTWKFCEEGNEI